MSVDRIPTGSRRVWWVGGIAALAVTAVAVNWWNTPPQPNVLLITLDTTRADRLGCYGHSQALTPTLDALAKAGVRFDQAFATAPLTLPSHATMMTGLYPPEHGLRTNGKGRLHQDVPTLSRALQRAGYRTGAFVGAFVLDSKFGLEQGFDQYDDDLQQTRRTEDPLHRERAGNVVVDRALAWLGRPTYRPFFCWVHLYDPHFPYQPHRDDFGTEFEQRPYDGELAFVDRQIQRLMDYLKSNPRTENTLVVVVGDHGEGLGDHQEAMHGYMLYNSTLRVPWLAVWPGHIPPDVVVEQPVSLVDLTPTVLDCLQIPLLPKMSGRSLTPSFSGQPVSPSPCYAETDDPRLDNGWSGLQMFLTPDWKYIRTAKPELFRWRDDPGESRNLASSDAEQLQAMNDQLLDFLAGLSPRGTDLAVLSPREKRVLESLGYTAGQSSAQPFDETNLPDIKDMVVHFNRVVEATHLLEEGRLAEAEKLLRETVEQVPDYATAWGNLGRCLARQGRIDEARACYQQVLDRNAEDVSALLNLATADLAQQRPQAAAAHLQRVLELDPESAEAHFYLAGVNMQLGKPDNASGHLTRALACDPEHVPSLISLADLQLEQGKPQEALDLYASAITLDPYDPGPYINRGIAFGQLERLDEAVACFSAGLTLNPDHPLLHSNLGFAWQQLGRYGEAIRHYEQALRAAPEEPLALINLPLLLSAAPDANLRDGLRAVELADRAVKASQGASPEAYDALAAAYAERGEFDKAVSTIDDALRLRNLNRHFINLLQQRGKLYRSKQPYRLPQ